MKPTVSLTLRLLLLFVVPSGCGLQIDLGSNDGGAAGGSVAGGTAGGTVAGGGSAGGNVAGGTNGGGSAGGNVAGGTNGGGSAGGNVAGGTNGGGSAGGNVAGGTNGGGSAGGGSSGGGLASDGGMQAFAEIDRTRLEFGEEYGEGVAVGTTVTETLQLRNTGALPMTFGVGFTGAPLFVVDSLPSGGSIPARASGFIRVRFGPADGGWPGPTSTFSGALQLTTSAPNLSSLSIPVSAKAVKP